MFNDDSRPQRPPMVNVADLNLTCAECGVAITELPFQPTKREDGTYGRLYCRACNAKRRSHFSHGNSFRQNRY